jgi:enamine deaminase RidA (YjgF/YER057c/UK114 family)
MTKFERAFSGSPWESKVGYCRAVRAGDHIYVSGTAPVASDGSVFAKGDAYQQARRCFEIIDENLKKLGSDMRHIVRTRMFVTDITQWAEYGKAHFEFFSEHPPATTMIEISKLIDPDMLIEIEADAVCMSSIESEAP